MRDTIPFNDFYVHDAAKNRVEAFYKGWLACLKEIDTPPEHPRWSVVVPPVAYPDPKPNPYSLILLPGFEEEEYFKLYPQKKRTTTYKRERLRWRQRKRWN
ncbi:hypothetical protein Acr_00g0053530 [Actinidia rufa]|uniref:Uncharacterized protein n=1 Tax=Actinidia rufa TaxID=165716 RepID=A0A7J0DNC5_9ERIC|nr:hypothetical protein Acr_00g0053530 [Actinidia rufa]